METKPSIPKARRRKLLSKTNSKYEAGKSREAALGYAMIAPTITSFIIFLYIPFVNALKTSFYKYNGLGDLVDFVGFKNFANVLADPRFARSLLNTAQLMAISMVALPLGFILAYFLYKGVPGKKIFNTALFIPYLISMVVVGCIWRIIYDPTIGPLNQILKSAGLGSIAIAWLSRPQTALLAISVTWIWRTTPFNMLILYSSLMKMPSDILEAAEIDGANGLKRILHIVVPYLSSTFGVLFMLTVTNALRMFDLIWVMTKGGPGGASDVITSYIYTKAFTNLDFGGGTAASVLLMLLMIGIMIIKEIVTRILRRREAS